MSSLYEQIVRDRNDSRKPGVSFAIPVIYSTILGEIQRSVKPVIIDGEKTYPNADVVAVLKSTRKNWVDGGTGTDIEIEILNQYIPPQLTEIQIQAALRMQKPTKLGEFMQYMKANHPGLYDGRQVKDLFEQYTKE